MTLVVSRDYVVSVGEMGDVYASVERVAITILVRMYLDVFGVYFTLADKMLHSHQTRKKF